MEKAPYDATLKKENQFYRRKLSPVYLEEILLKKFSLLLEAPAFPLYAWPVCPTSIESSCFGKLLLKASANDVEGTEASLVICKKLEKESNCLEHAYTVYDIQQTGLLNEAR